MLHDVSCVACTCHNPPPPPPSAPLAHSRPLASIIVKLSGVLSLLQYCAFCLTGCEKPLAWGYPCRFFSGGGNQPTPPYPKA